MSKLSKLSTGKTIFLVTVIDGVYRDTFTGDSNLELYAAVAVGFFAALVAYIIFDREEYSNEQRG